MSPADRRLQQLSDHLHNESIEIGQVLLKEGRAEDASRVLSAIQFTQTRLVRFSQEETPPGQATA